MQKKELTHLLKRENQTSKVHRGLFETNRKKKIISSILDKLYPDPEIPLNHTNNFTFLVAVMLSAQSTDKKVNEITPRLFSQAKTPEEMNNLTEEEIRDIIREIGLAPTKARNIKKMSEIIIDKYSGKVPRNFEGLESLPGVGHKTASVIMSQAFNKPAFPVDTHIHRLAHRWKISNGKNVVKTEKDLKRFFNKKDWNMRHLQMIFYGREHCKARKNNCDCVVCGKIKS